MTNDDYRAHLVTTRQASQTLYDGALLVLSGGALGVSISFVKDITNGHPKCLWLLLIAWLCFAASCAGVLYSHYVSVVAHNEAIAALDEKREPDIASNQLTKALNKSGGIAFIVGLLLLCLFAYLNI